MVDEYDVVELLQTLVDSCTEIFDIAAAGILLADKDGSLELIASTSEASRLVELMQLSAVAGPCIECFATGQTVSVPDIGASPDEWSEFRDSALDQGFSSLLGIPLRLRDEVIGALNLMRVETGELAERDVRAATALANVATIGILQERNVREVGLVSAQLEYALSSRVIIEQAKGVLSHTHTISTDEAFNRLRGYARGHHLKLADVAHQVVALELHV
ncbi:GAF and ANTAR domain-containing protein [Subtercola sp. RTI3]|uniref:GAF and ANTAR domain-containing protein n=1 Tax=Subtercola sp. RTI3 TaxID=3048639 RepID=UPI002B239822|nr:GAF and ANTAR domain-containing protein [Subtercola sp. RTI3]